MHPGDDLRELQHSSENQLDTPFGDADHVPPSTNRSQSTGLPNGNLVVNASLVQKVAKRKYADPYSRSVSRSMVSMGIANQYVHLTQRTLPAVVGSRVRGVEMLPSDVPNIPSSITTVNVPPRSWQEGTPTNSGLEVADKSPPIEGDMPPDSLSTFSSDSPQPKSTESLIQAKRSTTSGVHVRSNVFRKKESAKNSSSSVIDQTSSNKRV